MHTTATSGRKKVANYQVVHELGQGGMGVVVRAEQAGLERPVVLKTLRRDLADNEVLEERFRREAQAAASIHHQNVVAVYDCFSWRGDTYIAQDGFLTACHEAVPKWSFTIRQASIQLGGNAKFTHTLLKIKKIPVF